MAGTLSPRWSQTAGLWGVAWTQAHYRVAITRSNHPITPTAALRGTAGNHARRISLMLTNVYAATWKGMELVALAEVHQHARTTHVSTMADQRVAGRLAELLVIGIESRLVWMTKNKHQCHFYCIHRPIADTVKTRE